MVVDDELAMVGMGVDFEGDDAAAWGKFDGVGDEIFEAAFETAVLCGDESGGPHVVEADSDGFPSDVVVERLCGELGAFQEADWAGLDGVFHGFKFSGLQE